MAKRVSLSLRQALFAEQSAEVAVVLATVTHDELDEPVRFSSDPTERLSDDPLLYGTRRFAGESNEEVYYFVLMSALLPDDEEGTPPSTTLSFENVETDMVAVLRSITSPVDVELALVLASNPDELEERYTGLKGMRVTYNADQVSIELTREPLTSEPWPGDRMTKRHLPGLFG